MRNLPRLLLVALLGLPAPALRADEIVAVNSTLFNGYARTRGPDGKFLPEYVVFGEGGCRLRPMEDPAAARLTFARIARLVVPPLTKASYVPAANGQEASLMILVFWGSTLGSHGYDPNLTMQRASEAVADLARNQDVSKNDFGEVDGNSPSGAEYENALWLLGVANGERDSIDEYNARILGYTEALDRARFIQGMAMGRDVLQELGGNRYFVVLQAYDYAAMKTHRVLKPMWTTRMSVSESGDLASAIDRMVASSVRYFGRDTGGLKRERVPEGTVELGPLRIIGTVSPHLAGETPAKPADGK